MSKHLHDFFDDKKDYDFQNQLKLHIIFYACNSLGQVKISGEDFLQRVKMIGEIMKSKELRTAFKNFKMPDCWSLKLKIQIFLIKKKLSFIYALVL
jgi:hypothetical protein